MKILVAKIFCLWTVLLLSSNIAISSIPLATKAINAKKAQDTRSSELKFQQGLDQGSSLNFIAEKDPFEEFEDLFIDDLGFFNFKLTGHFQQSESISLFSHYATEFLKIPRWLWVRHILI